MKLSSYILKNIRPYLVGVAALMSAVLLDMISPLITQSIVDDVIIGKNKDILPMLLLGMLGIGIGRAVLGYTKEYCFDRNSSKIMVQLRRDVFHHIQTLSAEYFDRSNTGELMARVKDDVDTIWDALSFVGMLTIEVVFHTGMIIFCMLRIDPLMTLIPFTGIVVCGITAIVMEKKLGDVYEQISDENAVLNRVAEENLGGVRTVRAFGRERFEIQKFMSHNRRWRDLNLTQSRLFADGFPIFAAASGLVPILVLPLGGYFVMKDRLTIGQLSAFVQYSTNIVWPMQMLGWLVNSLSSASSSLGKLKAIFNEKPAVTECEEPVECPDIKGGIEFKNVCFHKADGYEILHDISFSVKPGETLGIMGATGAGKTSIIQLLQRMYDVTGGEILLDGVDIRKMKLGELRTAFGIVSQEVFLFSDRIMENISLGKKGNMPLDTVIRASSEAQAKSFIERLGDRYDTVIGERGVGLSGGQKQMISIARALSHDSPVLVLDDSTSALDMETEHEIQKMLENKKGITRIIIAHRISAVRNADEIIVLDNGRIAERGTHESLLSQNGLYRQTYDAQY